MKLNFVKASYFTIQVLYHTLAFPHKREKPYNSFYSPLKKTCPISHTLPASSGKGVVEDQYLNVWDNADQKENILQPSNIAQTCLREVGALQWAAGLNRIFETINAGQMETILESTDALEGRCSNQIENTAVKLTVWNSLK